MFRGEVGAKDARVMVFRCSGSRGCMGSRIQAVFQRGERFPMFWGQWVAKQTKTVAGYTALALRGGQDSTIQPGVQQVVPPSQ